MSQKILIDLGEKARPILQKHQQKPKVQRILQKIAARKIVENVPYTPKQNNHIKPQNKNYKHVYLKVLRARFREDQIKEYPIRYEANLSESVYIKEN